MYDLATPTNAMRELSLFSGAGGGLLATTHLLKWRTVCYVEWEAYCIQVLKQRIADGYLHDAPIWDDVQTFDGRPWAGCVDIVTAGFPCQPFSGAGDRDAGDDPRNMWPDTIRVIREVSPEWVLLENVTTLLAGSHGYYGHVLGELAQSGYDAKWRVLSALELGAPHQRDRLFVVAHSNSKRFSISATRPNTTQSTRHIEKSQQGFGQKVRPKVDRSLCLQKRWGYYASGVPRVSNGLAHRVDRLKAIGNGQVPAVASTVWRLLTEEG